jgi:heme exporter protein D
MYFATLNDFLLMGNHAVYVWSGYGMTALVLVGLVIAPLLQRKQLMRELPQQYQREAVRQSHQEKK